MLTRWACEQAAGKHALELPKVSVGVSVLTKVTASATTGDGVC